MRSLQKMLTLRFSGDILLFQTVFFQTVSKILLLLIKCDLLAVSPVTASNNLLFAHYTILMSWQQIWPSVKLSLPLAVALTCSVQTLSCHSAISSSGPRAQRWSEFRWRSLGDKASLCWKINRSDKRTTGDLCECTSVYINGYTQMCTCLLSNKLSWWCRINRPGRLWSSVPGGWFDPVVHL